MTIKTALIAQSPLFRAGVKHVLRDDRFEIIREDIALPAVAELENEVDLLLVHKPHDVREIEDELKQIREACPDCKIVLLAGSIEIEQMAISFAAGVDGFLLEEISHQALLESLGLVMLGEKVFPSRLAAFICSQSWHMSDARFGVVGSGILSQREADIVSRLAAGLPNKVIADELTITESTVKVHLKSILKKLRLSNRTQAAVWALNNGLAAPPRIFR